MGTISQDPIGFDAGDANLRRYVGNKSTFAVDPSGLDEYGRINRETDNAWIYRVSKFDPGYAAVLRQALIHQEEERTGDLHHIRQWEVMAERNANKAMSHVLASSANAARYAVDRALFAMDKVTNAPFLLTGTTPDDVTDVWLILRYGQTGSIMVTSPDEFGAEAHDTRLITNWLVQESANPLNWFAVGSATYLDDIARYGKFGDDSADSTKFWQQTVSKTSSDPRRLAVTGLDNRPVSSLAETQYEQIRNVFMSDIETVARNTGLSAIDVQTMKKHLFFGKHSRFDTKTGTVIKARFEANSEVADAWFAASKGPLTLRQQEWFRLLRNHELGERAMMGRGVPFQDLSAWQLVDGEWEHVYREGLQGAHEMAPRGPVFWPFD